MPRPHYPSDDKPHNRPGYRSPKQLALARATKELVDATAGEVHPYQQTGRGREWAAECAICNTPGRYDEQPRAYTKTGFKSRADAAQALIDHRANTHSLKP